MMGESRAKRYSLEGLLLLGALLFIAPVLLMALTSFKPDSEIIRFTGLLPDKWTLDNYREILGSPEEIPLIRWFFNSVFISSS